MQQSFFFFDILTTGIIVVVPADSRRVWTCVLCFILNLVSVSRSEGHLKIHLKNPL